MPTLLLPGLGRRIAGRVGRHRLGRLLGFLLLAVAALLSFGHGESSVDDRAVDQRSYEMAVVPADRARRLRHEHDRELLLRIGPPGGAVGAGPGEVADRAGEAGDGGGG